MLVTYLFPIFHLQCNQDKDLQATAQTTRNRVNMNDKLLMVRVESSLFAVVVIAKFDFYIACYLKMWGEIISCSSLKAWQCIVVQNNYGIDGRLSDHKFDTTQMHRNSIKLSALFSNFPTETVFKLQQFFRECYGIWLTWSHMRNKFSKGIFPKFSCLYFCYCHAALFSSSQFSAALLWCRSVTLSDKKSR